MYYLQSVRLFLAAYRSSPIAPLGMNHIVENEAAALFQEIETYLPGLRSRLLLFLGGQIPISIPTPAAIRRSQSHSPNKAEVPNSFDHCVPEPSTPAFLNLGTPDAGNETLSERDIP